MYRLSLVGLIAAALYALQATPQSPDSLNIKLAEVPLLDCSGLPCVDMSAANGKTFRLLIDLADVNSFLDAKGAKVTGLPLQPLKGNDGNDISEIQQTVVAGAKLGDLPMGDFPFMVFDTATPEPNLEKHQPLPADGALAYSAFKNRILQIDYAHHVVRISEPQTAPAACPRACSGLIIKHFGGDYGPITLTTDGFTINGQPVEAQLDTLFTGTVLVYPASVEKLGLKKQSKAKQKENFPYTQSGLTLARSDDGATASFGGLPLMQNGPLYFGTSDDHFPATLHFDATVGWGLLNHAVVTLDFPGMHVWIEAGG
jgi:hypothetical protein